MHPTLLDLVRPGLRLAVLPTLALDGDSNPVATTDLRRIYASVVSGLFGVPVDPFMDSRCTPLTLRLA